MSTKVIAFIALGAATVVGAATGGYMAVRRNAGEPAVIGEPAVLAQAGPTAKAEDTAARPAEEPRPAAPHPGAAAPTVDRPVSRPAASRLGHSVTQTASSRAADQTAASGSAPGPAAATAPSAGVPKQLLDQETPLPAFEPYRPQLEELTVSRDAVIGIRLETNISSETARVEDSVVARVARDVDVNGRTAISSGARLEGVVSSVERGGKFKDRARIGVRFNSLVLSDGTRLPIETETIFRESESPVAPAATKVGASAAIGGILGAVIGGKKGAAIGSTVGAAGGTAAVMKGNPADVVLSSGTPLTVRLTEPLTVTVQREQNN